MRNWSPMNRCERAQSDELRIDRIRCAIRGLVPQGGLKHPPWRWSVSSSVGFDSQSVVDGNSALLLASEVALGRLDGDVAEQNLDLVQFAAREMAGAYSVAQGESDI